MMLLMIRLESLYTDFILLKLIVNQDHNHRNTLIKTSHTIMSLLLSALNQRISLARHRIDLEWSVRRPNSLLTQTKRLYNHLPNKTNARHPDDLLRHPLRQRSNPRTPPANRTTPPPPPPTHRRQPLNPNPRPQRPNLLLRLADRARSTKLQTLQKSAINLLTEFGSDTQSGGGAGAFCGEEAGGTRRADAAFASRQCSRICV